MVLLRNDAPLYAAAILSSVVMTLLLMANRTLSDALAGPEDAGLVVETSSLRLPVLESWESHPLVAKAGAAQGAEQRPDPVCATQRSLTASEGQETEIDRIILQILLKPESRTAALRPSSPDRVAAVYPEGHSDGPPSAGEGPRAYTVRAGDTLTAIAKAQGVSVADLVRWNNIRNAARIRPGQRLILEGPMAATPASSTKSAPRSTGFLWPTVSKRVTSEYGLREDPFHPGRIEFHAAIDIGGKVNDPVYASKAGEVVFVGRRPGYGNMVILRHDDGFLTVYAHNHVNLVRRNQSVRQGQTIARLGSTGRSTAPHLHFEIRKYDRPLNPLSFFQHKPDTMPVVFHGPGSATNF